MTSYIRPTFLISDAGTRTPQKTKSELQRNPAQILPICPCSCELMRVFRGRSRPLLQWCTTGRTMKAGPSMWSGVQEGSCAEDSLCSTTGGQWKKVTEEEVIWSACPPPPLLYYEIWSDLLKYICCTGLYFYNYVFTLCIIFTIMSTWYFHSAPWKCCSFYSSFSYFSS